MSILRHRARSLVLLGVVWVAIGVGVLINPPD